MSSREETQADFDLEKLFELMDEALTSRDERVQSALRGLLTIIELTRTQDDGRMAVETRLGPLRRMQEDLENITRRLTNLEGQMRQMPLTNPGAGSPYPLGPYTPGPYNPGYPNTGTPASSGPWWGIDPNGPWTTSKSTSASSYTLTGDDKDSTMTTFNITK
jgi:hypothetical protein